MKPEAYRPAPTSVVIGCGIWSIIMHICYFGCGILLGFILAFGIIEIVRTGTVWTNTETLLNYTAPFPECDDSLTCCTQFDCPVIQSGDLKSFDNTSWWAGSNVWLTRDCVFGKCHYIAQYDIMAPNMSLLCTGENWQTFIGTTNSTTYYNSTFPRITFLDSMPIVRTVEEPWGDPISTACLAFLSPASQTGLKVLSYYFNYNNTSDNMVVKCLYTHACVSTFAFAGNLAYPQGAAP